MDEKTDPRPIEEILGKAQFLEELRRTISRCHRLDVLGMVLRKEHIKILSEDGQYVPVKEYGNPPYKKFKNEVGTIANVRILEED